MNWSLRTKLFLLILVILLLVAGSVSFFSKQSVDKAMLKVEQLSAMNVLHLTKLNISGRYKNLLMDKVDAVKMSKARIKELSHIANMGLTQQLSLEKTLGLEHKEVEKQAMQWISRLHLESGEFCFVFDEEGNALSYPTDEFRGKNMSKYTDIKGRSVLKAAVQDIKKYGEAYSSFRWPKLKGKGVERRFGYFTRYPNTHFYVAAVAPTSEVESEVKRKMKEILTVLKQNIPKIRFAETGYVFIVTGEEELIIPPRENNVDFLNSKNKYTGNPLLVDIMAAAETSEPVDYLEDKPGAMEMESFVGYFKALDWYIVTVESTEEIKLPAQKLVQSQFIILGVVLIVSLILGVIISTRISRPIIRLADFAKQIPDQDFTQESEGDSPLLTALAKNDKDEVGRLAGSFLFMEDSLRKNIRNLMDVTASKQKIESELSIARDIQMGLLPKIFPPFPEREEFDLHAMLESAKEVGGDLYDFFFIDENLLCFTVGDVSDKGVPAALFMAVTKTLITVEAEQNTDPSVIMNKVNDVLAKDNPNSMFVTLFLGIIDLRTGEIHYSNGGHNPPVMIPKTGEVAMLHGISGPMCGALEGMEYSPLETKLEPGDAILLYTDGVTEAMTLEQELYSDEKLVEMANTLRGDPVEKITTTLMRSVHEHAGEAPQSDDITILCLRYFGPDHPERTNLFNKA